MQIEILPLEEFDGKVPMGTRLRLTGIAPQRTNDLSEDEEVILIVRAKVGTVSFSTDAKKVRSRVHSAAIQEAYIIPDGENHSAIDWLSDIRAAHKVGLDKHAAESPGGQQVIGEPDDEELRKLEAELEAQEADEAAGDELAARRGPEQPPGMSDEEWEASAANPLAGAHEAEAEAEPVSPRKGAALGKTKQGARP